MSSDSTEAANQRGIATPCRHILVRYLSALELLTQRDLDIVRIWTTWPSDLINWGIYQ